MIEVRIGSQADLDVLVPLVMAYHRFESIDQSEAVTREAIKPLLEDSGHGHIWLILSHGEVVGYVAICFGYSIELGGRDAVIDEMYLLEEHRGHGIGSVVMEKVMHELARFQVRAVHLEVARTNEKAQHAYEKWAFRPRTRYFLMTRNVTKDPSS